MTNLVKIVIAICALNLNGLLYMLLDIDQAATIVLLLASLIVVAANLKEPWNLPKLLLLSSMALYLVIGLLKYNPSATARQIEVITLGYMGGILVIASISSHIIKIADDFDKVEEILKFSRNIFQISAISVLFSSWLNAVYINKPQSYQDRMGGFFANPNEAAMASLVALALAMTVPAKNVMIRYASYAVPFIAVILTFSKSAIVIMIAIFAIDSIIKSAYLKQRSRATFVFVVLTLSSVLLVGGSDYLYPTNLTIDQERRVAAISDILTGRIDEHTTTGRTVLWTHSLQIAWSSMPFGSGLGSGHHVVGGLFQGGQWQGTHNTFLLFLLESGAIPFALLIASFFIAAFYISSSRYSLTCSYFYIIFMNDLMVTHTALVTRYDNIIIGLFIGMISAVKTVQDKKFNSSVPNRSIKLVDHS